MKFVIYIFIVASKISLSTYLLYGLYYNNLKVLSKHSNTIIIDKKKLNSVSKNNNRSKKKNSVKSLDLNIHNLLKNDIISKFTIEEAIKQLENIKFIVNQKNYYAILNYKESENNINNLLKTYYNNIVKIYLSNDDLIKKIEKIISYISVLFFINGSEFFTLIEFSNKVKNDINNIKNGNFSNELSESNLNIDFFYLRQVLKNINKELKIVEKLYNEYFDYICLFIRSIYISNINFDDYFLKFLKTFFLKNIKKNEFDFIDLKNINLDFETNDILHIKNCFNFFNKSTNVSELIFKVIENIFEKSEKKFNKSLVEFKRTKKVYFKELSKKKELIKNITKIEEENTQKDLNQIKSIDEIIQFDEEINRLDNIIIKFFTEYIESSKNVYIEKYILNLVNSFLKRANKNFEKTNNIKKNKLKIFIDNLFSFFKR